MKNDRIVCVKMVKIIDMNLAESLRLEPRPQ